MTTGLIHHIDAPAPGALLDPLALRIDGWIAAPPNDVITSIEVRVANHTVAQTRALFWRPDVNRTCGFPTDARCGFSFLGHLAETPPPAFSELEFRAHLADGSGVVFARRPVRFIATDYRQKPYGVLLQSHATQFRRRHEIYGSGPSQDTPSPGVLELLRRFLGPPPVRVLDVGCGIGSYGRQLLADGYQWLGAEIDADDCAELARLGLPHVRVDGNLLPFGAGEFDSAICAEVLEHIAEPRAFLAEIRRVAPRLLVSVPNIELLAYLSPYQAVPWHMLEGDHKNFFTRWGLRGLLGEFYGNVEVMSHSPAPLPTIEGTPLDYHLLAIASA